MLKHAWPRLRSILTSAHRSAGIYCAHGKRTLEDRARYFLPLDCAECRAIVMEKLSAEQPTREQMDREREVRKLADAMKIALREIEQEKQC